jgi:hypothetical protein
LLEISATGGVCGEIADQATTTLEPSHRWAFSLRADANCAGVSHVTIVAGAPDGRVEQSWDFAPLFYTKKSAKEYAETKAKQ